MLASRSSSSLLLFSCMLALGACNCDSGRGGGGGFEDADIDAMEMDALVDVAMDVTEDVAPDVAEDTQADVLVDTVPDTAIPPGECAAGAGFALPMVAESAHLHYDAAWDGEALWVAYSVYNETASSGEVWATRIGCDGSPVVAPFRVASEIGDGNSDPGVAVSDGRLMIVWQQSLSFSPMWGIRFRLFETNGTAISAEDVPLDTRYEGEVLDTNHWTTNVAPHPQGFAVTGTRGFEFSEETSAFTAFSQVVGADGEFTGDATFGLVEPVSQSNPQIAVDSAGSVAFVWGHDIFDSERRVYLKKGDAVATPLWNEEGAQEGGAVAYDGTGRLWAATSTLAGGPGVTPKVLVGTPTGIPNRIDAGAFAGPSLAGGEDGVAVAFHGITSGARTNVLVAWRDDDGVTEALQLNDDPSRSIYPIAVTHVAGSLFFVAWSEGDMNNRLVGRGRVVDLSTL